MRILSMAMVTLTFFGTACPIKYGEPVQPSVTDTSDDDDDDGGWNYPKEECEIKPPPPKVYYCKSDFECGIYYTCNIESCTDPNDCPKPPPPAQCVRNKRCPEDDLPSTETMGENPTGDIVTSGTDGGTSGSTADSMSTSSTGDDTGENTSGSTTGTSTGGDTEEELE